MKDKAVISLKQVGLAYPGSTKGFIFSREKFWALKDISFEVTQGEVLGIVGRNGAGKSTLLNLLAGITTPDTGSISFRPDLRSTLLSLQAGFEANLTGKENAILSGMLLGMRRKEVLSKMKQIVDLSGLGAFIDKPLRTYSTGMRARLGFATAYYTDTDIMLLDEILSVGDAYFAKMTQERMEERIYSDKTAILVSHSEKVMKDLCPRLIWIENGELKQDGDTDEVWRNYRQSFKEGPV
ncbi:ATP-binding cassette domain-containing protein [Kiritimatiellota bacterium B12222]|nr:ATP-binding cassette domain-containing protein [Kiritimatiellota bacterium B12222]